MTELKPCAHCGAPARMELHPYRNSHTSQQTWHMVSCSNSRCGVRMDDLSERRLAKAWNRRAEPEKVEPVAWMITDDFPSVSMSEKVVEDWRQSGKQVIPLYTALRPLIPEGWKLMPKHLTQEMHDAASAAMKNGPAPMGKIYQSLYATAPQAYLAQTEELTDFADAVKQLCKDFSDLRDRPYMGDVHAAIDGLLQQFTAPQQEQK